MQQKEKKQINTKLEGEETKPHKINKKKNESTNGRKPHRNTQKIKER